LLLFCLEAVGSQPYHQTAFIAPAGSADLLFSYSTYSADHFRNKKGEKLPTYNDYFAQNYKIYGEYAFSDQNSFTFNGGYTFGKTKLDGNKFGFDDLELGWKHLINAAADAALTFELIGIIPCMKYKPLITYGRWGVQAGMLYSQFFTFQDFLGWYDLGAAYRYYQGFPSDQIRSNASLGMNFGSNFGFIWTCIGSFFLEYGVYNGKDGYAKNHIFLNPSYRLVKAQLECRFSPLMFPYLTMTLGGFIHVWERQISLGSGFVGGTWFDF
jgi:hypothetical protein